MDASISIDLAIVDPVLDYDVYPGNKPDSYTFDPTLVTLSTEAICPTLIIDIVNNSGFSLD